MENLSETMVVRNEPLVTTNPTRSGLGCKYKKSVGHHLPKANPARTGPFAWMVSQCASVETDPALGYDIMVAPPGKNWAKPALRRHHQTYPGVDSAKPLTRKKLSSQYVMAAHRHEH